MSPSLIRCLLAVLALSEAYDAVVLKDVAHLLGLKRPTVHHSLCLLQEKGLVRKEPYGDIRLTEEGRRLGERLEAERDDLVLLFSRVLGLSPEESTRAALVLTSELREESRAKLRAARLGRLEMQK